MKLLTRFLTFVLSLLLSALIIAWSTLTVLGSATTVNGILLRAKVYELAAEQSRTSLQNQPNIPAQYKEIFETALNNSLTTETMQAIIQPLLVDMIGWLNQPSDTPPPRLVVNLSPVRTALLTSIRQAGLSPVELLVIETQINQQLPDQLDISQAASLGNGSGGELTPSSTLSPTPAPTGESQYVTSLRRLKTAYAFTRTFAYYGLAALVLLAALVIFLSRHEGRKMLRRPAWVFMNAGILTLLAWAFFNTGGMSALIFFVVKYLGRSAASDFSEIQTIADIGAQLSRELAAITIWYGLASLLTGGVLYGLSFFIHKTPPTTPGAKRLAPQPPTTPVNVPGQPPVKRVTEVPAASPPQPNLPTTKAPSDPSSAA